MRSKRIAVRQTESACFALSLGSSASVADPGRVDVNYFKDQAEGEIQVMRVFKVLVVTAAVLLGLVAVLITAINVIPGEKFKPLINSAVSSATGRNLTIGGDLNIDLFSTFTFSASDVRFSNPAWGSRPEMFSGGTIEGELALLPLLNGVLDFSLVLQAPDLLLETDARGRGNWQMGEEQAAEEAAVEKDGDFRLRPLIRELRFEQVNLAYLDGKTSNKNSAVFETILLASRGNQVNIELDGEVNGIPVLLSGGVDGAADTIPDQAAAFTLAGKAGEIQLDAKGMLSALSATADVDLLVKLDAPSLAAFTPLTAQELPEYGPFSALIQLSGSDGDYAVTDLTANLDAEALSAAVKGSISALSPVSGISLAVNLETARLPEIVEQAKVEVPVALP
ncbi:MAG: AsmA family protein, partial [Pseudomonadota bacterium]